VATSIFPVPSESSASAFAATVEAPLTTYEHEHTFTPGIYTVTVSPNGYEAKVTFCSDTAVLFSSTTSSSTVSLNLTSTATKVFVMTFNGTPANAIVTITKTADSLTSDDIGNGTLDTINTTGTYNQTGVLGVLVFGGGAQGESKNSGNPQEGGGAGGRAGFINGDIVITNEATTVTIGAGGIASINSPVSPTNSSFGNLVTTNTGSSAFPNAGGGGAAGGYYAGQPGGSTPAFKSWNGNFTTGGGAGSGRGNNGTIVAGGGSGIGTGGSSPGLNSAGLPAGQGTGKASGGAGGKAGNNQVSWLGGNGAPGVVYVMRGF
jgi:hypothetical protein